MIPKRALDRLKREVKEKNVTRKNNECCTGST